MAEISQEAREEIEQDRGEEAEDLYRVKVVAEDGKVRYMMAEPYEDARATYRELRDQGEIAVLMTDRESVDDAKLHNTKAEWHVVLYVDSHGREVLSSAMEEDAARVLAANMTDAGTQVLSVMTWREGQHWVNTSRALADAGPDDLFRVRYTDTEGTEYTDPLNAEEALEEYKCLREQGFLAYLIPAGVLTGRPQPTIDGQLDDSLSEEVVADEAMASAKASDARDNWHEEQLRHDSLEMALRFADFQSRNAFSNKSTADDVVTNAQTFEKYLRGSQS